MLDFQGGHICQFFEILRCRVCLWHWYVCTEHVITIDCVGNINFVFFINRLINFWSGQIFNHSLRFANPKKRVHTVQLICDLLKCTTATLLNIDHQYVLKRDILIMSNKFFICFIVSWLSIFIHYRFSNIAIFEVNK